MKGYNSIIIMNSAKNKLLFCKRMNDPYEGLYNFVGGKIEQGESSKDAAYRELHEETGITGDDVELCYFMDFRWHLEDMSMEVYVGVLRHEVELQPEKHPLLWLDFKHNFFDMKIFAGEGNIGHMIKILKMSKEFFGPKPLTLVELKKNGCIYIEKVEEGFKEYSHQILKGSREELYRYLKEQIIKNGPEHSFLDCYYGRLSEEEKKKIQSVITKEQVKYMESLHLREDQIYFQMTEELFEIAFELSVTEALFSTFYFSKYPCTVWSNYDYKFIVFC